MNPIRLIIAVLCFTLSPLASVQAQEMDKELSDVATKLATLTKDNGKKKVTVLDFTDLQGGSSELGKYVAEQLTVDLVMVKTNFSVLDRANLKKILAEHKLTATGLIDPENAKKLGQFAGVDALILGTIVSKGQKVALTAKIITTDTAEIVGAAKSEFKSDDTVQHLLSQSATSEIGEGGTGAAPATPTKPAAKPFGDMQAKLQSVKLSGDRSEIAQVTFVITNTSATVTYGVGITDFTRGLNLSNSRPDVFRLNRVSGIESLTQYGGVGEIMGTPTDVPPNSAITITADFFAQWTGKPGNYPPYRLQFLIAFGEEENGRYPKLRKHNLIVDMK